MPRFTYKCPVHSEFQITLDCRKKTTLCPRCNTESRAIIKSGSFQTVERLDNGLMVRAVERLSNIEEIMEERNNAHNEEERQRTGLIDDNESENQGA